VKGKGRDIPDHVAKEYWGSRSIAPPILNVGPGWIWVVIFTPGPVCLPGKSLWYPLNSRMDGPHVWNVWIVILIIQSFSTRYEETKLYKKGILKLIILTWCFSDRASWIDYILITILIHWLLFIHKILFSSTCFEPQVLIFRRIQLHTCSIWYCHSLWEFLVACRYTAWVRTDCRGEGCWWVS